jgi:hypothetical protein
MKALRILFILTIASVLFLGCSHKPPLPAETTHETLDNMPDWYSKLPTDPAFIYGAGTAVSRDLQLSMDKSTEAGRLQVSRNLEVKMEALTKTFSEELGSGMDSELLNQFTQSTHSVISQVLVGSRINKSKVMNENGLFRAYVVMELPLGEANQALLNQVKANQNMYTRFRATEAWQEMEKEVAQYEKYKQGQTTTAPAPNPGP